MNTTINALKEILPIIKWGNISKEYLGYSRSWIYQRLNGYEGCEFTEEQKDALRKALIDLSNKIADAASKI